MALAFPHDVWALVAAYLRPNDLIRGMRQTCSSLRHTLQASLQCLDFRGFLPLIRSPDLLEAFLREFPSISHATLVPFQDTEATLRALHDAGAALCSLDLSHATGVDDQLLERLPALFPGLK